jgi:hypothetical protein
LLTEPKKAVLRAWQSVIWSVPQKAYWKAQELVWSMGTKKVHLLAQRMVVR